MCNYDNCHFYQGATPGETLFDNGDKPRGRHGGSEAGARRGAGGEGGARATAEQGDNAGSPVTDQ